MLFAANSGLAKSSHHPCIPLKPKF